MDLSHLEWPFFDAGHRAFAASFADWANLHLAEYEGADGGDGTAAREIFERLTRGGWLKATLPLKEDAGEARRLDLRPVCLLREISAHSSAMADVALSEPWLGLLPILFAASRELRARYVPRYLQGKLLPAFALSEPDAGSDAAAIATVARRDGNHYVLNGRKTWTSNAGLADLYVVFARTDGPEGTGAISASPSSRRTAESSSKSD